MVRWSNFCRWLKLSVYFPFDFSWNMFAWHLYRCIIFHRDQTSQIHFSDYFLSSAHQLPNVIRSHNLSHRAIERIVLYIITSLIYLLVIQVLEGNKLVSHPKIASFHFSDMKFVPWKCRTLWANSQSFHSLFALSLALCVRYGNWKLFKKFNGIFK